MRLKKCLIYVLSWIFTINPSFAEDAKTVTMLSDYWFPLNGDPSSAYPGFGIEIISHMLKQEGLALDYHLASWGRSLIETAEGNIDCVIGAGYDEGANLLFADEPIFRIENNYFVASDSKWQYTGYSSLIGLRVALVKDNTYGKEISRYTKEFPELVIISGGGEPLQKNISLLVNHRVDILVEEREVMKSKIAGNPLAANIKSAGVEESDTVYLACNKYTPLGKKMIAIYNKHLPLIKNSEVLNKILKRYALGPEVLFQKN